MIDRNETRDMRDMKDRMLRRDACGNDVTSACNTPRQSCGGCAQNENANSSSVKSMKKRLMKVEFALIETNLYLDAYPMCRAALNYYRKLVCERDKLVTALSEAGSPVTAFECRTGESWSWVDGPWPWQE